MGRKVVVVEAEKASLELQRALRENRGARRQARLAARALRFVIEQQREIPRRDAPAA